MRDTLNENLIQIRFQLNQKERSNKKFLYSFEMHSRNLKKN